jgi:hypothetical protein
LNKAVRSFGRLTEAKHLTEENAWVKDYDWGIDENKIDIFFNGITKEQRPLTEAQYRDSNYTLNTGE